MKGEVLTTTRAVMLALGGPLATARLTDSHRNAAENWQRFEAFPARTADVLRAALKAIGKEAAPELFGQTPIDRAKIRAIKAAVEAADEAPIAKPKRARKATAKPRKRAKAAG